MCLLSGGILSSVFIVQWDSAQCVYCPVGFCPVCLLNSGLLSSVFIVQCDFVQCVYCPV